MFLRLACVVLLSSTVLASAAPAATLTGSATNRERMALPPAARFEATLEDVSRADAPSRVLGRATVAGPLSVPIAFAIDYDPAALAPTGRYAVRARILDGDALLFTTDTVYPVPVPPASTPLQLMLVRVRSAAPPPPTAAAAPPSRRLRGAFVHFADTGMFEDCLSGERLVVAHEGDNAALEAAYLKAASAPKASVLVAVDGHVEMRVNMEGPARPTLIVERFVKVLPGTECKALDPAPPPMK